jgi:Rne/Rng family ribonuclease
MSSKELVISANRHETRVALLEDDQLVEVYFQRSNEYSLAGSIHKGRVTRVLPGMQSAFVDLGLERDTFLYVSDFLEEHEDIDRITGDERYVKGPREERPPRQDRERDRGGDRERGDRRPLPQPSTVFPPTGSPAAGLTIGPPPLPGELPEGMVQTSLAEPALGPAAALSHAQPQTAGLSGSGAAPERREEQGDRGDRRGRRSRRRRNRGRGFPDSKYAGDADSAAPEASAPAAEPTLSVSTVPESAAAGTPLVLPGESLAKYRHAPRSAGRSDEADLEDDGPEEITPLVAQAAAPQPTGRPAAARAVEVETENEYDEPVHYPPENALPDAPVHFAEPDAPERMEEIPFADVPPPLPPMLETEGGQEQEPAVAPMLDEDEDRDIQAMILGEAGLDEEEEEIADEEGEGAEGAVDAGAAPAGTGETEAGGPEGGSAQVRERGGRYPHRVSRRMRRGRGRGPEISRPTGSSSADVREVTRPILRPAATTPSISDLLKEGQEIIVQIAKEPLGQKGARITSHVALPGRYVVYMPTLEHMGVSRKIASDEERLRLKRILQGRRPGPMGGFITRTAAEGRTEEEIAADMQFLYNLWQDIRAKADRKPAPLLLHHDLDIVQRILRDQLADTFKAIWIDSEDLYENVLRFVERFQPALVGKVKLYTRDAPIFDAFGVTGELEKALRPKVWLKSGGYIVINQTEALVAVDVNTGKFVGKSNRLEDTIVKTNTEAIKEIVRQIRLRDLGGIIVIDFIDMDERKNRTKVMQVLEEAMRVDRAPYKILQFNDFGLVAITRKRVKQSLERTLCSPCPHCEGAGYIKSVQTVITEILAEARKMAASVEGKDVLLRVHPDVAKVLKSHQNKFLEELEDVLRRPVLVKSDPLLHHEKFDLA